MDCRGRIYSLRRPEGHEPKFPRWRLQLSEDVESVFTIYVGVQSHDKDKSTARAKAKAIEAIGSWTEDTVDKPLFAEDFNVVGGADLPDSKVWVCYWTDRDAWTRTLQRLRLPDILSQLGKGQLSVGLWCESFSTPVSRLETIYSGLDYRPGLAKLPNSSQQQHGFTTYWGAARDRLAASSHDEFKSATESNHPPHPAPRGLGERLIGTNYNNMVHIRSGQFWENCKQAEREAYEEKLEPTLLKGLSYLWENPVESGCMGLRYLQNLAGNGQPRRETCAAGFFCSLADLEEWAKSHPSHLAIYHGQHKHSATFGDSRKLRTWHEVSVLKEGEALFDYVNCQSSTGVLSHLKLRSEPLE